MPLSVFPQPDVLIAAEASVGEGPVIDHRTGRLCWVDIVEGMLYENDLTDGRQTAATLGTMVGAVAPREQAEGFAVAVADGFGYWTSGQLTIADPVLPEPHRRMNDAKCDSRGRLWAGSTHMQFVPGAGALHRWDGGSSSVTMATGFTLPNGLGWNHEDTTMYLIDSMTNTLLRAAFDADEGEVGEFVHACARSTRGCLTASRSTSTARSGWRSGAAPRCAASTAPANSSGSFQCQSPSRPAARSAPTGPSTSPPHGTA